MFTFRLTQAYVSFYLRELIDEHGVRQIIDS